MLVAICGMAAVAFLAATPLPAQSEAAFIALQAGNMVPVWLLIVVSGIANTAGSVVTWALGRGARHLEHRLALPADRLRHAENWYRKWGRLTLLLSWAPLGDVICFIAGGFRVPLWQFVIIVGLTKTARYAILAGLTAGVISLGWT